MAFAFPLFFFFFFFDFFFILLPAPYISVQEKKTVTLSIPPPSRPHPHLSDKCHLFVKRRRRKKKRRKNREINAGIRHYNPGIINQTRLKPRPFPLPCQTISLAFARLFHMIIPTSADRPHQHQGLGNAGLGEGGRSSEHQGLIHCDGSRRTAPARLSEHHVTAQRD
jgi:hypothetical protein